MKASTLHRAIQVATHAKVNLFVKGPPGTGKTTIIHQTVRAMGRRLIHQVASQTDAVDIRGLPSVTADNRTTYALPSFLPTDPNERTTVVLDEFTKAPLLTMNTYAEWMTEGTIGGPDLYTTPKDTTFVLSGNRRSDRAGENAMPSHLNNRVCHITHEVDADDWVRAAYNNFAHPAISLIPTLPAPTAIDETLIAYVRSMPTLLHQASTTEDAYPTPRSIAMVNRMLPYLKEHQDLQLELISGCVGEGFALGYTGFLRIIGEMFDPDLVFKQPTQVPVPENPNVKYALIVALAARVTKATANPFFIYMGRLPGDFAAVCVQDALSREPLLMSCKEGVLWGSKNAKLLSGA